MKFKNNCPHDDGWHIARQRGTRVRFRCNRCGHLDKWVKHDESNASDSNALDDLDSMDVKSLRELAKANGITGYSKMNKATLRDALHDARRTSV